MRGELERRLTRLTAGERALLEQMRAGLSVHDEQLVVIHRKLEVRSGLAAVAVLVRATEPPA